MLATISWVLKAELATTVGLLTRATLPEKGRLGEGDIGLSGVGFADVVQIEETGAPKIRARVILPKAYIELDYEAVRRIEAHWLRLSWTFLQNGFGFDPSKYSR